MKYSIDQIYNIKTETMIIGIPTHLNQMPHYDDINALFETSLQDLKQHHVIESELGQVRSTIAKVNDNLVRLISVGVGNRNHLTYADYLKIFGYLFQYLKDNRISSYDIFFDTFLSNQVPDEEVAATFGLQSEQAIYEFDNYKSNKKPPFKMDVHIASEARNLSASIEEGKVIGESINIARNFSNMPPNILTPDYFAEEVKGLFKGGNVEVDIKDEHAIEQEGFGLLQAVGKGSINPPRLVTLTYKGAKDDVAPVALVGKGITYDSGGYSIKSKQGMPTMKFDMCGASNVIGMMNAIAKLELPINVVGVIAMAENMISNRAMKPDDVFTALSGETVEVPNTDAEGRLVLGDAVFYSNQFQPRLILDFATLTGASVVALGSDKAAVMNHQAQNERDGILKEAAYRDEFLFELPITSTERQAIRRSDVADLTNHVNAHGKALFAAAFVTHFSGETPHLHFDIAGPATTSKASHKGPKGPTGYLIQLVVNWIKNESQQ
ncbi:leucyl aminopeptidase family protein [Staphylococcus massiliensis]|uniref:Probable cytosol aminopeptidase n=1 Tax=Staphylococcus massiliensis S46 TaxID=1229783 RepID=K9B2P9_9STAP|nr:cytosol aminopeptidase [Staphylococcus massiliensis S46]POA00075.1 leucyl aminopeptidase family protein [Staphylococcus massiliensis CCUG 55927]